MLSGWKNSDARCHTSWSWERWRSPAWQSPSSRTPSHVDTVQDSLATRSARWDPSGSHRMELQPMKKMSGWWLIFFFLKPPVLVENQHKSMSFQFNCLKLEHLENQRCIKRSYKPPQKNIQAISKDSRASWFKVHCLFKKGFRIKRKTRSESVPFVLSSCYLGKSDSEHKLLIPNSTFLELAESCRGSDSPYSHPPNKRFTLITSAINKPAS